MSFALLFILAFLIGLGVYCFSQQWLYSVCVPMVLFIISIVLDGDSQQAWLFSMLFGLPIVFFGSLLGAYVYQIRCLEQTESEPDDLAHNE